MVLRFAVRSAGFSSIKAYVLGYQSHNGVNFAFSGATTSSAEALVPKLNANASSIRITLETQLQWLDEYLKGFCQKPEGYCFLLWHGSFSYRNQSLYNGRDRS